MAATQATAQTVINDKREIFGWAMYDWANSAFSTTIGTVFLGPYVASLAATAAKAYPDGLAHLGFIAVAPAGTRRRLLLVRCRSRPAGARSGLRPGCFGNFRRS